MIKKILNLILLVKALFISLKTCFTYLHRNTNMESYKQYVNIVMLSINTQNNQNCKEDKKLFEINLIKFSFVTIIKYFMKNEFYIFQNIINKR